MNILLDAREREGLARLGFGFFFEALGRDRAVTLEHDTVDDRVLDHPHNEIIATKLELDIAEQVGLAERADRQADPLFIENVARLHEQVGKDGARLDALVALHQDARDDDGLLGLLRPSTRGCRQLLSGHDGASRRSQRQSAREPRPHHLPLTQRTA